MTRPEVSSSAANVALARAHLTWLGVVDDPYARQMLPPSPQRLASALQLPGLRRLGRHPSFPGLAARTLFFDVFVGDALDGGLRQVVTPRHRLRQPCLEAGPARGHLLRVPPKTGAVRRPPAGAP
jgi:O-methyltransferase involved in polyketide biosynthesis